MRSPIKKGQIRAKGSKNKSRPGRIDNSKNVLDIADNTTFIRSQVLTCVSNTFQIDWNYFGDVALFDLPCKSLCHAIAPDTSQTLQPPLQPCPKESWHGPNQSGKAIGFLGGTAQLILFLRLWLPFPTSFYPALVDMFFPCWLDYPPPYMRPGMLPHLLTYTRW